VPYQKRRVLVIDDSPLICSIIKEAVKKHDGFECNTLCEAGGVLELLYDHKPDILVLDAQLPGINGLETVHNIRESKQWGALPLILLANKESKFNLGDAYDSGADDIIYKPFDPVELMFKIKSIFRRMSFTYHEATSALEKKTIRALGRSVEVKDKYTEGHSARVAFYSVIIAKALFLSEKMVSIVEDAGYLHDLGKIGIHEEILNKPDKLNDDEWQIMRTHPEKSAVIVESLGLLEDIVPMVKGHHERWDGSGYPQGLYAEEINLGARIISVADAFDAMTSNRAFRSKKNLDYALEELTTGAGKQFDAQIANLFVTEIKKFPGIETLQSYTSAESLEMIKFVKG